MVRGSGTPMGTDVPSRVSGWLSPSVEFTVASVGPYALNIRWSRPQRATSSGATRSVPASSTPGGSVTSSGMAASSTGGRIMTETSWAYRYAASSGTGARSSLGTTTRRAPESSDWHSSQNATSKLGDAKASTRSSGPTPSRSVWVATSLSTPACVTSTPFGRPVDPEV
ncbi:hypothetical protein Acsp06_41290 [Actinomycetospora sp. NBRC 106375]|nr:hypothetical protein Acsp06_41290 [Actinomycetospora sp. NBRC 106375]